VTDKEQPIPKIELRPIDSLVAYARNSRAHSDEQITQIIMPSLVEFGWTFPVLADDKGIVAGHGRVMAARRLYDAGVVIKFPGGAEIPAGMVPVIDCSGWTESQRKAYIIMDNRSAEKGASWDHEMLKLETEDLLADGFDLSLTGFSTDDLAEMFALDDEPDSGKDPDEAPDLPGVPHSKPGDVWVMGPHRVVCGDSTDPAVWDALMQGEMADGCWCDPPYNVGYESKLAGKIENDSIGNDDFLGLLKGMFSAMFTVMKPGASIYVAHSDTEGYNFRRAYLESGFKLSGCVIWEKDSLVLGRSDYQWQHEPILYGWKPGNRHKWFGGRKQTTIARYGEGGPITQREDGTWVIKVGDSILVVDGDAKIEGFESSLVHHEKPKRSADHPTMKPVGLICKQLKSSARPGDIILDCCGGSGSTMMAAEELGMCGRLSELDPKFVDVIVIRWQNYTGRRAVHAVTGEMFPI
jgi:DNA modification methylase